MRYRMHIETACRMQNDSRMQRWCCMVLCLQICSDPAVPTDVLQYDSLWWVVERVRQYPVESLSRGSTLVIYACLVGAGGFIQGGDALTAEPWCQWESEVRNNRLTVNEIFCSAQSECTTVRNNVARIQMCLQVTTLLCLSHCQSLIDDIHWYTVNVLYSDTVLHAAVCWYSDTDTDTLIHWYSDTLIQSVTLTGTVMIHW